MILISLFASFGAEAQVFKKGYFKISDANSHRSIYFEHKLAKENATTFVLLNGLTYETRFWHETAQEILKADPNAGIVMFDFWGQGKTLLKAVAENSNAVFSNIPAIRQASDYIKLVKGLDVQGRIVAVGLSYGGGIAAMAEMIDPSLTNETVLVAPYLEPTTSHEPYIQSQIRLTRLMFPLNPASDEQLYDYFLRQAVFASFPRAEPVVLENPYKLEGIFRLIQGVRKIHVSDMISELPKTNKLHLVQPTEDQYIKQSTFNRFWDRLPRSIKGSRALLLGTEHRVPEHQPHALVFHLVRLAKNPKKYKDGSTYTIDPSQIATLCESSF